MAFPSSYSIASAISSYNITRTTEIKFTTCFRQEPDGFWSFQDCTSNGTSDLIYIKTQNTDSGAIEVHIANSESNYTSFILQIATIFREQPGTGTWLTGYYKTYDRPDLIFVKTKNTGRGYAEVHIASSASSYQRFILQVSVPFPEADANNGFWHVFDFNGDGNLDLVYIKNRNTRSGNVELWVTSGASHFQQVICNMVTGVEVSKSGIWTIGRDPGADKPDLIWLNNGYTASGKVEVFKLPGCNGYQKWSEAAHSTFAADFYDAPSSSYLVAKYKETEPLALVKVQYQDTESSRTELEIVSPYIDTD